MPTTTTTPREVAATDNHTATLAYPGSMYPYGVWRHRADIGRAELMDRTRTRSAAEHAARLLDCGALEHCPHLPLGCKLQPVGTHARVSRRLAARAALTGAHI